MKSTTMLYNKITYVFRRVLKPALFYLKSPISGFKKDKIASTVDGTRFLCRHENQIERMILDTGEWEVWESSIVRSYVKPNFVVLDVGANIGYFSFLMSKLVGSKGQVHCFEPTSYGYNRMMKNIKLNAHLPVENLRLNKKGLLAEICTKNEALESRFSQRVLANSEPETMVFTTIDDYCVEHAVNKVDFIKIDVDGYDFEAMKGAVNTLTASRPVVLAEFCQRVLESKGSNVSDYISFFIDNGYKTILCAEELESQPIEWLLNQEKYQKDSWNLLLLP
jgi:FkbM family methyltransferase